MGCACSFWRPQQAADRSRLPHKCAVSMNHTLLLDSPASRSPSDGPMSLQILTVAHSLTPCLMQCETYEPVRDVLNGSQCNVWVYHPLTKHCWLKHETASRLKAAVTTLSRPGNPSVSWTSGVVLVQKPCADCVTPASYNGCISKDMCNTTRECGSPAIDGISACERPLFTSPQPDLGEYLIPDAARMTFSLARQYTRAARVLSAHLRH